MAWRFAIVVPAALIVLVTPIPGRTVDAQPAEPEGTPTGETHDGAGAPTIGGDSDATNDDEALRSAEETIRFAENSFVYGDYADVVSTLEPLLLPTPPPLDDNTLVRAFTLLGTAAHFEGLGELADRAFLELLLVDPRFRLDPLLYPPPVIARMDTVREENAALVEALLAEETAASTVYFEQSVHEQSLLVSMLPFGYGFLASDREGAGLGYLVSESVLGVSMLSLYLSNEIARDADGFYARPDRARNRRRAQYVLATGFTAVVVANIIHGAATHDQARRVDYRTLTEPPPEYRRDAPQSRWRRWDFSFAPILQVR